MLTASLHRDLAITVCASPVAPLCQLHWPWSNSSNHYTVSQPEATANVVLSQGRANQPQLLPVQFWGFVQAIYILKCKQE